MNFIYPRKFIAEFLHLYRAKECLWRKKLLTYKNKTMRQEAYDELLQKFREMEPSATISDLRTKIEQWRSTYRRQLKQMLKSTRSDYVGPIYTPRLWYFPLLTFLHEDQYPDLLSLVQSLGLPTADEVELAAHYDDNEIEESSEEERSGYRTSTEPRHRKILRQLLQMYRDTPCLWHTSNPGYSDMRAKAIALKPLLEKYRQLYKGATSKQLWRRLYYCRSAYRRELRRMLEARERGEVYTPKMWYFKLLSFLHEQEYPELSHLLYESEIKQKTIEEEDDIEIDPLEWSEDNTGAGTVAASNDETRSFDTHIVKAKEEQMTVPLRKMSPVLISKDYKPTQAKASQPKSNLCISLKPNSTPSLPHIGTESTRQRDRFDIAAENIACKLRELTPDQRIRAEKIINDVLYYAELNDLDCHSGLLISDK